MYTNLKSLGGLHNNYKKNLLKCLLLAALVSVWCPRILKLPEYEVLYCIIDLVLSDRHCQSGQILIWHC
jgi:hypothetical protein